MEGEGGSTSRMIKLLRMLRLLKLLRLARINRLMRKYEEEFASLMTTFKLGKLIVVIVVVGHWLSCLFFFAGGIDSDAFPDGEYDPGLDPKGNETVGWVFRHFDQEECGPGHCYEQKYLTSFCERRLHSFSLPSTLPSLSACCFLCQTALLCPASEMLRCYDQTGR
eukprot:COSAG06_NODE_5516_length_3431_cov_1.670468_2_plen_166_part_00